MCVLLPLEGTGVDNKEALAAIFDVEEKDLETDEPDLLSGVEGGSFDEVDGGANVEFVCV